jgi:hypothetical protein
LLLAPAKSGSEACNSNNCIPQTLSSHCARETTHTRPHAFARACLSELADARTAKATCERHGQRRVDGVAGSAGADQDLARRCSVRPRDCDPSKPCRPCMSQMRSLPSLLCTQYSRRITLRYKHSPVCPPPREGRAGNNGKQPTGSARDCYSTHQILAT